MTYLQIFEESAHLMYKINIKLIVQWEVVNFGANHVICMEVTYKTMKDNLRYIVNW